MVFDKLKRMFKRKPSSPETAFMQEPSEEETAALDWDLINLRMSRRTFLKVLGLGAATAYVLKKWPFEALAGERDYIIVTIDTSDRKRNSLWAVVTHYCDENVFLRYYNAKEFSSALRKLAQFNGISDPGRVNQGQRIKLPRAILIKNVQKAATETQPAPAKRGIQSPFGGMKKPIVHQCWTATPQNAGAGSRRICPFDLFGARRDPNRWHQGLDLYCEVGTPLYPIKPGIVTGAGHHYLDANTGKEKKFHLANGISVRVQAEDGLVYIYIHLSRVDVDIGDRVSYETQLGLSGVSGNPYPENPHVHVAIRKNGVL
ncbi:MAG: M23 family metallopeptidase, partial [Nanoarchaeota archaeon]